MSRISNAKFPRREITRKCRDRADTLHEIGSPRRAYHASLLAAACHLFFARVSEAAPSSRCRRSPFSKQRGSCSGDRSNTPFLPPSLSLTPVLSSFLFRLPFFYFSHLRHPLLAILLTLSRSCVSYVRTNSISRDSLRSGSTVNYFLNSRSRPTLLQTCASSRPFLPFLYSPYPWLGLFLLRFFRPTP